MTDIQADVKRRAPRTQHFGPRKYEIACFLELIALTSVAICQPVLSIFGDDVASLVPLDLSKFDVVAFILVLVFAPPAILWLAEVSIGALFPPAREWAHCLILGVLAGFVAIDLLKYRTSFSATRLVLIGVVVILVAAALLFRSRILREFVRFLAIAPVIIVTLFFVGTQARALLVDSEPEAAKVSVEKPARVVFIVMDEFPAESLLNGTGAIDAGLFPNFNALSQSSTWYRNTTTVAPNTTRAVPAILSGNMPRAGEIPSAFEFPHSIFTLLGNSYAMNAHESVTRICPDSICHQKFGNDASGLPGVLSTAFSEWKKFTSPERHETKVDIEQTEDALESGIKMIEGIRPTKKPALDFVHLLLPHVPWHYLAGGYDTGFTATKGENSTWGSDVAAVRARQRYLMQLQAADWYLGKVIARLKAINEYDSSLIVLTADHGMAFTAGQPIRGYSASNFDQILWVPLFVKAPQQLEAVRDDLPVLTVDILPTVADILDVKVPWKVDGRSTLGSRRSEGNRPIAAWRWSTVAPAPGETFVNFDGAAGFSKVLQTPAWNPGPPDHARVYGAGRMSALVGRSVDRAWIDATQVSGRLNAPAKFADIDVNARDVPWVHIAGRLDSAKAGADVAVVVNGVIAGVAPTSNVASGLVFSAFAMPSAFRQGANDVEVFAISGPVDAPRLVRIATSAG